MPANRFGSVNTQPIYNATGRNPREIEQGPQAQPFQAPAAGVAKDFNPDQRMQPQPGYFAQNLMGYNPLNPLSRFGQSMMWGRGGGRGSRDGGGDGEGGNGSVTYNINFAEQGGHSAFDKAGQVDMSGATITGEVKDVTGGSPFSTHNQNIADLAAGATPSSPAAAAPAKKPRAPRTDAQKQARNERDRNRRAQQKASGQKPAPRPRKPSAKKTSATAAAPSVSQSNTARPTMPSVSQSGNVKNVQSMGNF